MGRMSLAVVHSRSLIAMDAMPVQVEVHLANGLPSFTLVVVDPRPQSDFVSRLREQRDQRIWISEGPTLGTLSGFVDRVLPDLREEEILRKVEATHRALEPTRTAEGTPDAN